MFSRNNLSGVDFRTASNFAIDPEDNKMKGAKFSSENLEGLLKKYGIIVE